MADSRWRVGIFGRGLALAPGVVRWLLRVGLLSGTELARPPGASGWRPLHETEMFAREVPHLGEPAVAAHRRRAVRWVLPAMAGCLWLALFAVVFVSDPPDAGEILPILLIVFGMPAVALAAWTAWFWDSIGIAVAGRRPQTTAGTGSGLLLPDLDFVVTDQELEALRAQLEVVRDCQDVADDPATSDALDAEATALSRRLDQLGGS